MSQASAFLDTTGVYSGLAAANRINGGLDALLTGNKGAVAPANGVGSVAKIGQVWIDDSVSTLWTVKMFDGVDWIPLYQVDTVNNAYVPIVNYAPFDAMACVNIAVNGNMEVSQELGTAGATMVHNTSKYVLDCWDNEYINVAGTAVVTAGQVLAASFPTALPGYAAAYRVKTTSAGGMPAVNGDTMHIRTRIEGRRIAKLGWGAAGALPLQIGFWFYSTATGVSFARIFNGINNNRCYHAEFNVTGGAWQWVTLTIPGDVTGSWATDSSTGLVVDIFCNGKQASPVAPNAWGTTTSNLQTTNSTNLLGLLNNQVFMTGVVMLAGSATLTSARAALMMRSFDEELSRCKRYWQKSYDYAAALGGVAQLGGLVALFYPSNTLPSLGDMPIVSYDQMRIAPAITIYSYNGATGKISTAGGTDLAASSGVPAIVGEKSFVNRNQSGGAVTLTTNTIYFHYVANARM